MSDRRHSPHSPMRGPVARCGSNQRESKPARLHAVPARWSLASQRHRQKLSSCLAGGPANTLAVLISPLKDLVGVDSVLTRHAGNRCTRHKRRFNDPPLLLARAMNPLRPTATCPNFNRVAHKKIVGHADAYVYTARSGRLRLSTEMRERKMHGRLSVDATFAKEWFSYKARLISIPCSLWAVASRTSQFAR